MRFPFEPSSLRFAVIFLALFFVMQGTYSFTRDTWVERLVIDRATVGTSAMLINAISGPGTVVSAGHTLQGSSGRLSVLNGCEGTESLFLLVAAIVAFPMSWRSKILGALCGAVLVFVLNQIRIVGLYFVLRRPGNLFEILHGVVAPIIIVAAGCAFFLFWIERARRRIDAAPA